MYSLRKISHQHPNVTRRDSHGPHHVHLHIHEENLDLLYKKRGRVEPIQGIIQKNLRLAIINKVNVLSVGPLHMFKNTMLRSLNRNGKIGFLGYLYVGTSQCSCESINGNFVCLRRSKQYALARTIQQVLFPPLRACPQSSGGALY